MLTAATSSAFSRAAVQAIGIGIGASCAEQTRLCRRNLVLLYRRGACFSTSFPRLMQRSVSFNQSQMTYWESVAMSATLRSVKIDFRPRRIILLRHGESMGNVDQSAYVTTADWRIPLTPRGREQAAEAGRKLRDMVGGDGQVFFYYSPYKRTKETLDEMMDQLSDDQIIGIKEEPRICEQQIGNFQNVEQVIKAKQERHEFGRFFYRFPSGEAGLDVYNRVSSFITTLVRDCYQFQQSEEFDLDRMNIVIVTHGLSLRLFLMRWFQFNVDEFEMSCNPENAQLITMNKKVGAEGHKWYELDDEDRQSLDLPECCGVPRNVHLHSLREAGVD